LFCCKILKISRYLFVISVAGYAQNAEVGQRAILWENGEAQNVGKGQAIGVHVSGDDVHVAGATAFRDGNAWLLKNGEEQPLQDNNFKSRAVAVYVSGKDVYTIGVRSKNAADPKFGTLWKNGSAKPHRRPESLRRQ